MALNSRLLLLTFALILLAAASLAMIGQWQGKQLANRASLEALQSSATVQRYFQERRSRELELISELLASDRTFVAYITQAMSLINQGESGAVASILDLVDERRSQLGFDAAIVLSPQGRVIADSRSPLGSPRDLSSVPLVAAAMRDLAPTRGIWIDGEQALQIAIVPLLLGRTVEGLLLTGLEVDDDLARDIGRVGGTEVLFTRGTKAPLTLLAANVDLAESQAILNAVADGSSSAIAQDGSRDLSLAIGNDELNARVQPIADGEGLYIVAVPVERRLALVSGINQLMLWGFIAASLVILLVPLIIWRSVLRPLARLADGAERAGRGDLPQPIRVESSGDIGRLGRSINRVLADLREQKEIESYLAEVWQQLSSAEIRAEPAAIRADQLPVGEVFGGRYEIRELVDTGGMGLVYRAIDRELGEVVALKTLRTDTRISAERIDQLKTEIRTARRITHANVVRTFDFGQIDGLPFISMEFVRGITLREALKRSGRVRLHAGLRIARQLCAGLSAAHRAGVLHLDIKPSNVMLGLSGNAKLMDFGISRGRETKAGAVSGEQTFAGTPHYLSPEQCRGRDANETSDIYSFGVVLSEMFTGDVPIDGKDTLDICLGHMEREPIRPSSIWPDIPPALESLILRCLEKEPSRRYPNTDALRDDLERLRF